MRTFAGSSWRWLCVGAATLALCLLPSLVGAVQTGGATAHPHDLLRAIQTSADRPYQGYAESRSTLGVPDLPALDQVAALASGTTRIRAWYASPDAWRAAVVDPTGEVDVYGTPQGTYTWDFARNLLTETVGQLPARLPRAADLLPPELARRLLADTAGATVTTLPGRRVAGISAAGLRVSPADPDTTVGRIDVWADPVSGLPLQVDVRARAGGAPLVSTRFLQVRQTRPADGVLTPARPASAGFTTTNGSDLLSALPQVRYRPLPDSLAGRLRAPAGPDTPPIAAAYGSGLATFAVVTLPGRYAARTLNAVRANGGIPISLPAGEGYQASSPLLSLVVVARPGGRRTFLLAGLVAPAVLQQAAAELVTRPPGAR
jgi:hypothetical protein